MVIITHKFINHTCDKNTEILIIGTFNPNVKDNEADFFYGRIRNNFWELLSLVFNENNLKKSNTKEKLEFMKKYEIDFIDLISKIECEEEEKNNYSDSYIDNKVKKWQDIIELLKSSKIKKVYFTRKTFQGIKNIKIKIKEIENYCNENNIHFAYLVTPSRFFNEKKLNEWKELILH